jgi:1,2-diacylglycerol 3-beta-glucosyltransferase
VGSALGRIILSAAVALGGLVALTSTGYLLVLAVAAFVRHPLGGRGRPGTRLAILVPAHDEERLVARCVRSLLDQDYPAALRRVLVVADNCTDATAEVAAAAGAEVWTRTDPSARGKGQALRWAMDSLLAGPDPPEAVVVVDADSVAEPGLLAGLASAAEGGHDAVQAEYLVLEETGATRERLLAAAFLLFHRVRFRGRGALGLPAALVGNGMLFTRRLLETHPWSAFTGVEDLEQTVRLRLAGVRVQFAGDALVRGPMAGGASADRRQRLRWEGGRFNVVRRYLPALVAAALRRHDPGLLGTALDLAVPPLGLLAMTCLAGTAVAIALALLGAVIWPAVLVWAGALLALPAYVLVGLIAARADPRHFRALLGAPIFLLRKIATYARLGRGFDPSRWERTERHGDQVPERIHIGGVPIDVLDIAGAVGRISEAFGRRPLMQVSTVNLDFLVQAHSDHEVRGILQGCELSVADGWPVVLLGRLLGSSIRQRIAGADLVPMAVAAAAERGNGVFLLGGQDGVAGVAASRLEERHPGLRASWYEPAVAPLDEMDDQDILARIEASGAELLLVALGHPKQERWIARNRDRLTVAAAIGVGCSLDLIAGRVSRAPDWMQKAGLEWLFRLQQEPIRLFRRYVGDLVWLVRAVPRTLAQRRLTGQRLTP